MAMALMSAGTAMLDSRGTNGQFGASLNKGMQAGLGTYVPMMMWQENQKTKKEDRDWSKEQDNIRNTQSDRRFQLAQETFEAESKNREERTNIARGQFGIAQQKLDQSKAIFERQNKMMEMIGGMIGGSRMPVGGQPPQTTDPQQRPEPGGWPDNQQGQYGSGKPNPAQISVMAEQAGLPASTATAISKQLYPPSQAGNVNTNRGARFTELNNRASRGMASPAELKELEGLKTPDPNAFINQMLMDSMRQNSGR